ncbi:unnamed protein product [Vicia faba]|uniref:Plasmodium falciparum erythrocyte membrane protein 1 acidic terminal segment domain-containing protein n=1 Tax=Vicia faba TaxID=3906 RepID=A0AAV0Z2E7_VICFA|nr:unnamed protein product [Vicia faba]
MIVHIDISKTRTKNSDSKKNTTFEKVSSSDKDTYVHEHINKLIYYMSNDNDTTPAFFCNYINPHVEPFGQAYVKPYAETTTDPQDEPHVEQSGEPTTDIPIFYMYLTNILNESDDYTEELRDEYPQM